MMMGRYRITVIILFLSLHLFISKTTTATVDLEHQDLRKLGCNFENDHVCLWDRKSDDSGLKWSLPLLRADSLPPNILQSGFSNQGPTSDHSTGIGFGKFIFSQRSLQVKDQAEARFVSPDIKILSSGICINYWFFMYGENTGQLDVTATAYGSIKTQLLWTRRGCHGRSWNHAQVELKHGMSERVFVSFIVRGDAKGANIALDDITVTRGPCVSATFSCDFDDGADTCGFIQSKDDDFDWEHSSNIFDDMFVPVCSNETINNEPNNLLCNDTSGVFREALDDDRPQLRPNSSQIIRRKENYFIQINSSVMQKGDTAILMSPEFMDDQQLCFRFFYKIQGNGSFDIISSSDKNDHSILWSHFGQDEEGWQIASIDLTAQAPYRLLLQATVNSNEDPLLISVDSIETLSGTCPDVYQCHFEDSFCAWQNDHHNTALNWIVTMGDVTQSLKYVRTDHTLGSIYGKYLLLNSSVADKENVTIRRLVTDLKNSDSYCLEFWYILEGKAMLHIRYVDEDGNLHEPISSIEGPQLPFWKYFKQSIKNHEALPKIAIEGVVDIPYESDILIDDLYLHNKACDSMDTYDTKSNTERFQCNVSSLVLSPSEICDFHKDCPDGQEEFACGYSCTFEDNNCRWTITSNKAERWNRTSRAELPGTLGAKVDHTTGREDGYFLYLLNTDVFTFVLKTSLTSPVLRKSDPRCELNFYVNPLTSKSWKITVNKITSSRVSRHLSISHFKPNDWQQITIPIGYSQEPFRVQIVAERISESLDCIALDDISFIHCAFPQPRIDNDAGFQCQNEAVIHDSLVCDFVNDCGDGSDEVYSTCYNYTRCDFETDLCGWRQDNETDDFDWIRKKAGDLAIRTGPHRDHTMDSSSGFFLQMTHQNRLPGDKVWIVSPVLDAASDCRMSIYLFLFGEGVEQFNVYTRIQIGGPLTRHLSTQGEKGQYWIFKSLTFNSAIPFEIILEGIKGYGEWVEIGVDDISLSPQCKLMKNGRLEKVKPTTMTVIPNPCQDQQKWQCRDQSLCLYKFQVCDFKPQCPDESDEENCGSCDFESSTCGWVDVSRGRYVWERVNSGRKTGELIMPVDHTHHKRGVGSYMLATDKGYDYTRISFLLSPILGHTSTSCSIIFYYWSTREGGISLFVISRNTTSYEYTNDAIHLWSSKAATDHWAKVTVDIGSLAHGFRLLFRYKRINHLPEVAFGLDDISFSSSCGTESISESCPFGGFRCHSTTDCLPEHERCDYLKNCPDGEDEKQCQAYKQIDFQYSKGWFLNDRTSDFTWERVSGYSRSNDTRPHYDLTDDSAAGRYLYMSPLWYSDKVKIQKSRIRSYVLYPNPTGDCFMRFFYRSSGDPRGSVQIYLLSKKWGQRDKLWFMPTGNVIEWKKVVLRLKSKDAFRVFIEGVRGLGYSGGVSIDGITFNRYCFFGDRSQPLDKKASTNTVDSCRPDGFSCNDTCVSFSKCNTGIKCKDGEEVFNCPTSCGFERGMCGWWQRKWRWIKSARWRTERIKNIESANTNLKERRGKVLMAGMVIKKLGRSKHLLISPSFKKVSKRCTFSLMYYYSGSIILFEVNIRMNGFDQPLHFRTKPWTSKSKSDQWNSLVVHISPCSKDFQIVIKLIMRNEDSRNFFILDNFHFTNCQIEEQSDHCALNQFRCTNGDCITVDQLCDLEQDCCDGSDEELEYCSKYQRFSFEFGMEGWKNIIGTKYSWNIRNGQRFLDAESRRPSGDHTKRGLYGRYLSTSRRNGFDNRAVLLYQMPALKNMCQMVFWHLKDCSYPTLCNITVYTETLNGIRNVVGSFHHQWVSNFWMKVSVNISMMDEPYHIIIEGFLDNSTLSTLNVDDIIFSPGCFTLRNESTIAQDANAYLKPNLDLHTSYAETPLQCENSSTSIDVLHDCNDTEDCLDGLNESIFWCQGFVFLNFDGDSPLDDFQREEGDDQSEWQLWNSSLPVPWSLRDMDDSLRQAKGSFLLAVGSMVSSGSGSMPSIVYLPLISTNDSCEIHLLALIPNEKQAVLVNYRTESEISGTKDVPLTLARPIVYGMVWQPLTVTISTELPFRLVINGVPREGAVGVDNILLGSGCMLSG